MTKSVCCLLLAQMSGARMNQAKMLANGRANTTGPRMVQESSMLPYHSALKSEKRCKEALSTVILCATWLVYTVLEHQETGQKGRQCQKLTTKCVWPL